MGRGCQLPMCPACLKDIPGFACVPATQRAGKGESQSQEATSLCWRRGKASRGLPEAPLLLAPQVRRLGLRLKRRRKLPPGHTSPPWRGVDFQGCLLKRAHWPSSLASEAFIFLGERDSREKCRNRSKCWAYAKLGVECLYGKFSPHLPCSCVTMRLSWATDHFLYRI